MNCSVGAYGRGLAPKRRLLRCGISAAALIAGLGASDPARAEDIFGTQQTLQRTVQGAGGRNADKAFWWWTDDVPSTSGSVGPTLDFANKGTIGTAPSWLSTIMLSSIGGNGGDGDGRFLGSLAPSSGGRGGNVSFTQSGTILAGSPAGLPLIALLSRGGVGGRPGGTSYAADGGAGGNATFVHNGAKISAKAPQTTGTSLILVQAEGGKGADGRATSEAAGSTSYSYLASRAGAGGAGGAATAVINAELAAEGASLAALRVLSQGADAGSAGVFDRDVAGTGRGGNGGTAMVVIGKNGKVSTVGNQAPAIIVGSRAGSGSTAGTGNNVRSTEGGSFVDSFSNPSVRVVSNGTISTEGAQSIGILAQSIGGDGGAGGSTGATGSATRGSAGGAGGTVVVEQNGKLTTHLDQSHGIVAQSIGGSGGKGGSGGVWGADGGRAGNGGAVRVSNTGAIETEAEGSTAIVAQSIGGGKALDAFNAKLPTPSRTGGSGTGGGGGEGGSGGFLFFGSGGSGGGGGNGGEVEVRNGGRIRTAQPFAFGVLAQSIGGGGGDGGVARAFGVFGGVAIGGNGGGGGDGGPVKVNGEVAAPAGSAPASITTTGNDGIAIFAQSVGGSGGIGGSATTHTGGLVGAVAVAIGGNGGKGGHGGKVEVDNRSILTTEGTDAIGIFAQSIGGGGGRTGDTSAYALAIAPPDWPAISVSTSIGGSGGDGGNGNVVSVTNRAAITTSGTSAFGIQALSIGGGGGAAGSAVSTTDMLSLKGNIGVPVSVGGSGGGGGNGNEVTVTNKAKITTSGQFAFGISAASIGGGGGSGGAVQTTSTVGLSWEDTLGGSVNDSINQVVGMIPTADSITANVGVGGSGGKGGFGSLVTVNNESDIHTRATNATAIFAQSVGGGGGTAGGFLGSGGGTLKADVNVGGRGGDGGGGGAVTVKNLVGASILTDQAGSHGIYAQSVGGGGGVGGGFTGQQKSYSGVSVKNAFALVKELLDVKKIYGDLNKPTTEQAKNAAKIVEWRKNATGEKTKEVFISETLKSGAKLLKTIMDEDKTTIDKLARSAFIVGLAAAKVKYNKQISDLQEKIKNKNALDLPSVGVDVNIGGKGGRGGAGGEVTAENAGSVATRGESSFGIFAQSVGGGGGAGGAAYSAGSNLINAKVTVGGGGNDAGAGGKVKVTNSGAITTSGALAYGILAQSVGGGGGIGGVSASGDTLSVSGSVNVGGGSGKSSDGGVVDVENFKDVTTKGAESHAIVAQSIGGGGGVFYVHQADPTKRADFYEPPEALDAETRKTLDEILTRLGIAPTPAGQASYNKDATILPKPALNVIIGGSGGAGGSGQAVTVLHRGAIRTEGAASFGIFAQSVGGGGGLGGSAGGIGFTQIGYGIGGSGGTAGQGGSVTVTLGDAALIHTKGRNSYAVFAQSVGGGGGYGGSGQDHLNPLQVQTTPYTPIRDGGSSGNGGLVTVQMDPKAPGSRLTVKTEGAGAHGIHAQSLGGGGGLVLNPKGEALIADPTAIAGRSRAVGAGGKIVVDTRGSIDTGGANAYGIYAQSGVQRSDGTLDPNRTGDAIKITHSGTINGGSAKGAAISVDGGAANSITIVASSRIEARSGIAILASFGRETVENSGTVIGGIDLTGGLARGEVNGFNNLDGAIYRSGSATTVNLGRGNLFSNKGSFDIAGPNVAGSTELIGRFEQSGSGKLLVDFVDPASNGGRANDHLSVSGTAAFGGRLEPTASWLVPGQYTVLTATGGISNRPVLSGAQAGGVALRWQLGGDASHVTLTPKADFVNVSGVVLSQDQQKVARFLQDGWNSNVAGMGATFPHFLAVSSPATYAAALDEVNPEAAQYAANGKVAGSITALRAAMSCPAFAGAGTLLQEGECVWGRVGGSRSHMAASQGESGYRQNDVSYRVGGQKEFAPNWFIGGALSYTRGELKDPDGVTSTDSDSYDASIALKHQVGNWLFAASGTIGKSDLEHLRAISIGITSARTRADSSIYSAGARFRAAYEFAFPNWYVRPYIDLDMVHTRSSSYRESGSSGLDLEVYGRSKTLFGVSPHLEIGGRFDIGAGYWLRPYGSVGFTLLSSGEITTRSSIIGAPASLGTFATVSRIPDRLLDLGAGLQLSSGHGFELTAEYQAQTGQDYISHTGSARLSWRF